MASDYDNIYIAIRNALVNNADVAAAVGSRVYNLWRTGTASTYPRINIGYISDTVNENDIRQQLWQISIFDDDRDVLNAQAVSLLVEQVLHWTSISVTGWTNYWIVKAASRVVGIDGDIAHVADDYLVTIREG